MSVRIVRLKNGEDVICDLFEVSSMEGEEKQTFGLQMKHPYNVTMMEPQEPIIVGDDEDFTEEEPTDEIQQLNPDIDMRPWAPLCVKDDIILKLDEVITVYETFPEIIDKYNELVEAANGRFTGEVDPTKGPPGVFDREPDTTG